MATKTRAKAKRRKTTVTKRAKRRKTAKKTRIVRKKTAKKAPPGRAARTRPEPTAKVAVKPRPVSQRRQPEAAKPPKKMAGGKTNPVDHASILIATLPFQISWRYWRNG